MSAMPEFTDEHRAILEVEREWWKHAGTKDAVVDERFGMSAARYHEVLNWVIDQPDALELDPVTVRRLRRARARRVESRRARRDTSAAS